MTRSTTALVLCLGAASRMRPLSLTCPKALLPFCGRPLLEYTLEQLRRYRIFKVVLVAGLHDEGFEEFESWGLSDGMNIQVVRCSLEFGSAGHVKHVAELLHLIDDQFLVIYGDSLFRVDLASLLEEHERKQVMGCEVTIAYHLPDDLVVAGKINTNYGIVWLGPDGKIERFVEKPAVVELSSKYANSGLFVLNHRAFELLPNVQPLDFSRDVFANMAVGSASPVFGFEIREGYRYDIGTIQDYVRHQFSVLDGLIPVDGVPWESTHNVNAVAHAPGPNSRVLAGVDCRFGNGVILRGHNIIGDGVSIGDGTELLHCVILDGTEVGAAVRIANAVIGKSCRVLDNVILREGTVLGDFSVVA